MRLSAHHVGIIVKDLARSKEFYSALGFNVTSEMDDGTKTICFMRLGSFNLELFAYDSPVQAPPRAEGRALGFRHLALRTDDVDGALDELKAAGLVATDTAVREVPGIARLVFFDDPDGVEIEVMQEL